MKNTQSIINIVLGVAVIGLLALQLTSGPNGSTEEVINDDVVLTDSTINDTAAVYIPTVDITKIESSKLPIAHINYERFNNEYKYIVDASKRLERKYTAAQNEIVKDEQYLQGEYESIMQAAQTGTINESEYKFQMGVIQRKMQELEQKKQSKSDQLLRQQNQLQTDFQKRIDGYLSRYSDEFQFSYIIGSGPGTNIMWASDSLDVTDEILKGMNSEYAAGN